MEKFYEEKGFYLASVNYEVKTGDDENIELIFRVKEYDKVRVKKVIFLGNVAFSDEELKSVVSTKEEHLFSFMDGSGNFKEFNFQTDIEKVIENYKNAITKGEEFEIEGITIKELRENFIAKFNHICNAS